MRKSLKAKSYLYPLPVLIIGSYDTDGTPNAMNAAWGTICDTAQVVICVSNTHKTMQNILKTREFTLAIADRDNIVASDYVGIVSANDNPDKLKNTGWTITKSEIVNAPIFENFPLVMECRLVNYDTETELMIGEVLGVNCDNKILDEKGKVDLTKFHPICYDCDTHGYYSLGEKVGQAFHDGGKLK